MLDSALTEWETVLQGQIQFVRVPEGQTANVVVRFRPSVTMKDEPVAGYVNWKRSIDNNPDGTVSTRLPPMYKFGSKTWTEPPCR